MIVAACAASAGEPSLARDILASTDCLIAGRVEAAYAALVAPGGSFGQILTLALTIYVAIFGYRLMLGLSRLTLAEVVPHFLKIGVILALVTSWSSYQLLIFELLFHGPEQLASAIVAQTSGTAGAAVTGQADVLAALQSVFDRITDHASDAWAQVTAATPVAAPAPAATPGLSGAAGAVPAPQPIALPFQLGAAQFVAAALWLAALVMMAASVGLLLVVRIILAMLLVIGPVFIACGLFSATRGLFEGWLRTTVKFAVVPLFTLPLTAALIAVLLPFVDALGDAPVERFRDGPTLAILVIVLVFAAVLFQAVRLAGGIASGIRLSSRQPLLPASTPLVAAAVRAEGTALPPSRAEIIVQSLGGARARAGTPGNSDSNSMGGARMVRLIGGLSSPSSPRIDSGNRLGQGYRRLSVTSSAARRNRA